MKCLTKLNRALSLILVFVLIVGLLPVNVFATEAGDDMSAITETETTAPTDETTAPSEETTPPSEETTPATEETTAPVLPMLPPMIFGSVSEEAQVSEILTVDEVNDEYNTDYLFVASDRHGDTDVIGKLIDKMETAIGGNELDYLALAGDMIGSGSSHTEYNSATVLDEVKAATSSLDYWNVDLVAGVHDALCTDDGDILTPYGSDGVEIYAGDKFYVYAVNEYLISGDTSYEDNGTPAYAVPSFETYNQKAEQFITEQAQNFIDWANGLDDKSKAIIVVSHYPLHAKRGDNNGAYIWHQALNTVATGAAADDSTVDRNVLFFHGHNHTVDTTEFCHDVGTTLEIQNGSGTTSEPIYYTYATAGYLTEDSERGNGQATLVTITDTDITLTKYSSTADSTAMTTITRVVADPNHEHTYETYISEVTCDLDGYTRYTCTGCGYSYKGDVITAPGHSFEDVYTAPTCAKMGSTLHTCTVCGYKYEDIEYALGHTYDVAHTAPTCTAYGYSTYRCTACSYVYVGAYEAATGHTNTETVVAPTCLNKGYTLYHCEVCGQESTDNFVSRLGHSYESETADGTVVYTCTACGDSYSEVIAGEYTYNGVTAFASGNSYVITLCTGDNYYALSHRNNTISPVDITVSDNQITSEVSEDMLWEYNDAVLSYEDDGQVYYLYAKPSGKVWIAPTLTISTTGSTSVTFSNGYIKMSNYYLRYSDGAIALNRSASTGYVFVQE